jgi:diaminohydroxyphosphoribosylaminopyrimidine deaminase/5-amino-6-(5-phosphoribosylamino)uracil reductase
MATPAELDAMRRAIARAAEALGVSNPNPAVGAVVLDQLGRVAGEGATAAAGGPHAEVVALSAAGERARGGTVIATLEPCAHRGRTGPCVDAIVEAGVRRVVYAVADPHPVAAGGAVQLRAAGVDVEAGVLETEARPDLEPWLVGVVRDRPFVTWKYAGSLDGRSAAADGTSRWITGPEARRDVHRLRAMADAVIAGIGTVLTDDASLTVRDWPATRQPLRVVVDSDARTPLQARVLDGTAPTLVAVRADADEARLQLLRDTPAEVVELPGGATGIDLAALLRALREREVIQLLLEGGATLAGSFVRAGLVDRVIGYHAPALLGDGPQVLTSIGVDTIDAAIRLTLDDVTQLGADVRLIARLQRSAR